MVLLKIGDLDIEKERWEDAKCVFDKLIVFEYSKGNENTDFIEFKNLVFPSLSKTLLKVVNKTNIKKHLSFVTRTCLSLMRLNLKKQLKAIAGLDYDQVLVSYSDLDHSSLLFYLIKPYLKKGVKVTRSYKETRDNFDFLEKKSFALADRTVLNSVYNKAYIEKKYPHVFDGKEMLFDLDEDFRKDGTEKTIKYAQKLSVKDKKIHAVLLAGRILSDPNDVRSGSRLYYVDLINKMLNCGIVIHLYTRAITPCEDGSNPYLELAKENKNFVIEGPLDISKDPGAAYSLLSRYDIGILHAHYGTGSSYYFDKVNLPHRYFAYQLAHVAPVDIKGENLLVDDKAKEKHALIVNDFSEITFEKIAEIEWEYPSLKDYIQTIFGQA